MELSEIDMKRMESAGYIRDEFAVLTEDGIFRLRNLNGYCFFFDCLVRKCRIYHIRPMGCEIYPINCDEGGDIFVDDFCQAAGTVSKGELRRKGVALGHHMRTIDEEAESRLGRHR